MKKINKSPNIPIVLTSAKAISSMSSIDQKVTSKQELTATDFDSSIYGHKTVKQQLKEDQHYKCAYCEISLGGDNGVVEHYRPKTKWSDLSGNSGLGYYTLAYDWTNLLCSCDICNNASNKGTKFPLVDPAKRDIKNPQQEEPLIINPTVEDPGDFLEFHQYIAVPKLINGTESLKGKTTIEIFYLNADKVDEGKYRRQELLEVRRDEWIHAKDHLDLLVNKGIPKSQAIEIVLKKYSQDRHQFSGMFRYQTMW